jgi:hypothetical protein
MGNDVHFTERQQKVLALVPSGKYRTLQCWNEWFVWILSISRLFTSRIDPFLPKVAAAISFISSLYIVVTVLRNRHYRSRVYHRLMLGLAINMTWLAPWQFWGTSAVPEGTPGVYGARGTTATCSAQGFMSQFGFSVPFYYIAMSLYFYQAVRNNFEISKYTWIEKWIHVGVYVFPLTSGFYLLSIDAFNYDGHACWVASVPFGCGKGTDVVCTRGPQNIEQMKWLLTAIPGFLVLIFPTVVMIVLYIEVRRKQQPIMFEARTVATQAALYLLALYWSYCFAFVNGVLSFVSGTVLFSTTLLSVVIEYLIGFWILLVYLRLTVLVHVVTPKENTNQVADGSDSEGRRKRTSETTERTQNASNSFSNHLERTELPSEELIFDGSRRRRASDWAQFIYEGDENDDEDDLEETKKWGDCVQN